MTYQEFEPHPNLKPYIEKYWQLTGNLEVQTSIKLIPDCSLDLILNLGEDFQSVHHDFAVNHEHAYLIGTMTQYKEHFLNGMTYLVGIQFKPGAFSFFYKYDAMYHFANRVNEFERGLFPDIQQLRRHSIPYLNRFFLDRLTTPRNNVQAIVSEIHALQGLVRIETLAKRHCITTRQLERHFQSHVGLSPKRYLNLVRYKNAIEKISQNPQQKSLMEIAFECGYYDHAHLSNAIKQYTGATPSELILSDFSKTDA